MERTRYSGYAYTFLVLVLHLCASRCDAVRERRAETLDPVLKQTGRACKSDFLCPMNTGCYRGRCAPGLEGRACSLSSSCVDGLRCVQRECTSPQVTKTRPTKESDSDETKPLSGRTCTTSALCPVQFTCEGGRCISRPDPEDSRDVETEKETGTEAGTETGTETGTGTGTETETEKGFDSTEYLDGMRIIGDELRGKNRISIASAFFTIIFQFLAICYKASKVFKGPSESSKICGIPKPPPVAEALGGMIFSILLKIVALVGYAAVQRSNVASTSTDVATFARESAAQFVNVARGMVLKTLVAQTVILLIADVLIGIAAFQLARSDGKNIPVLFWIATILTTAAAVVTGLATAGDITIWDQGLRGGAFSLTSLMLLLSVVSALLFSGISRKQASLTIFALLAIVAHVAFSLFMWFSSKGHDEFLAIIRGNMCTIPARCNDIEEQDAVAQMTNTLKLALLMFTTTNMTVAGTCFSGISYKRKYNLSEESGEEYPKGSSDEEQPPLYQD